MKFTINLATRRRIDMRLLDTVLVALLVVLLGLAVVYVREAGYSQAELAKLRELNRGAARSGGATVSQAEIDALASRVRFANALIEQKAVNWLALLDHLEEVVPPGVALSAIQPPQGGEQIITIAGAARSFGDLRVLLEKMEESKNFSDVYLLNHNETKVGQTQRGIVFTISFKAAYR